MTLEAGTGRWPLFAAAALRAGFRSAVALPLRLRELTLGALNLVSVTRTPMEEADVIVARAFADLATLIAQDAIDGTLDSLAGPARFHGCRRRGHLPLPEPSSQAPAIGGVLPVSLGTMRAEVTAGKPQSGRQPIRPGQDQELVTPISG